MGAEVEFIKDHSAYEKGDITTLTFLMLYVLEGNEDKFKLRLRPMDSMTEDEKTEWNQRKQRKGFMFQVHAENTLWLIQNGFDVFRLLESNQAIDKTKVK